MDTTPYLYRHGGDVTRDQRAGMLGHRGAALWFTGLSASGKSTLAVALELALAQCGVLSYRLDGDNIRLGINRDLGFSAADRTENIRRIGEISRLFVDAGIITLSSFISPYRADRDLVRAIHQQADMIFIEVFVDVPLAVAEQRDPKGLYRKARAGEIADFTGISAPYEAPLQPEIAIRSDQLSVADEVRLLVQLLRGRDLIPAA